MQTKLIAQGGPSAFSTAAALKSRMTTHAFDRLDVAVAYATLQGVKALQRVLECKFAGSRWLLGLDDAITQPEAIEVLLSIPGADVRVARLAPSRRFHPKIYRLWSSTRDAEALLVIGSGNMTQRGLQENAEATVLLEAENKLDAEQIQVHFDELWAVGHAPGKDELAAYKAEYLTASAAREPIRKQGSAPAEPRASDPVGLIIPADRTSENVIATAVARIATNQPSGVCTLDDARRLIPRMVPLTPGDLAKSNSQPNAKWVQVLRNIKSNSEGGPGSTNFIALGYLQHVPRVGYRVTLAGRQMLIELG